jgi:catechol 2,3-dioxygenase-like lactoylglutathione lyase family enzyme
VRLAEVVLFCQDLERSLQFYRDVLGLAVISPAGLPAIFLRVGEPGPGVPQQIVLVPRPAGTPPPSTTKASRDLHHIGLEVAPDALAAERQRLSDLGFPLRSGQHPFLPVEAFYLDDPDGNEIEIVASRGFGSWELGVGDANRTPKPSS